MSAPPPSPGPVVRLQGGRTLASIPEEEMNWYVALGTCLGHWIGCVAFDLFFRAHLAAPGTFSDRLPALLRGGYALGVPFALLVITALWIYRRKTPSRVFTYVLLAFIGITHAYFIHAFGAFSTPILLIFPADLAMVYIMYRDNRYGSFVWAWGNLLLIVPTYLSWKGILPYAPVFSGTEYEIRLHPVTFWFYLFAVVVVSGQIFWITLQVKTASERMAEATRLLSRANESMSRLEGEATIGRDLAMIAHELRTPLSAVKSILESTVEDLRRSDGKLERQDVEDLSLAIREQRRGLDLVGSLRNVVRGPGLREESVDLNRVVADALRILQALQEPGRAPLQAQLHPGPLVFKGSHAEMMQVVLNLARNAMDASPRDKPVRLSTGRGENGMAVLRCRDEGAGIPENLREKVFEPLFTTKEVDKGTGLGLPLSRDLVERRKGTLVIEASEMGRGTTFRVEVPLFAEGRD